MKKTKTVTPVIGNAIIWAAMMIASSLLMTNEASGQTMMILMIGGWFSTHQLMPGSKHIRSAECGLIQRFVGRSK